MSEIKMNDNVVNEKPKIRARERSHPYTAILNRIKSKICYNKNRINELQNEPEYKQKINQVKIEELKNKIDELEYSRFMLKLCNKDKALLNMFCEFKGIKFNVDDEIERIASTL